MIKKLLSIAAVVVMPLFAANAQESVAKVVFEEDFSLLTTGEVGAPDTETAILNADGTIKSEYIHKAGWKVTSSAQSAGGAIFLNQNTLANYMLSPKFDVSASVDQEITVEFDAYINNEAGRGYDFIYALHPNATSTNNDQWVGANIFYGDWTHVTFSTNAEKSIGGKALKGFPGSGVLEVGIKTLWNTVYIKNLKVTINVDPNAAGGGEAKDFSGKYSFTSTKEITATSTQAYANWAQQEFDFNIKKNEGDDADVYPFIIENFPVFINGNDNSIVKNNTLNAKVSDDGSSLIVMIGHNNFINGNNNNHRELCGPNGKDDTAETLTISPVADSDNYTIVDGFSVIAHTPAFAIFPEEKINLCKYTDIVITRTGDVDAIDTIVADEKAVTAPEGVFTINGAKIRNTNDASDLQPGFYIIGGKKVVIR